ENYKGAIARDLHNGIAYGTTELHVLRAGNMMSSDFLFYISQSPQFRKFGTGMMYGTGGQKRIGTDFVLNTMIPIPPLREQKAIVEFIIDKIQKTATAIALKQKQITALREYKATLINSAVTGKIKII